MIELLALLMLSQGEPNTSQMRAAHAHLIRLGLIDENSQLTVKGNSVVAELKLEYKKLRFRQ